MKLLLYTFILTLGFVQLINANGSCNPTQNTNVLETAFGPVIVGKLQDQTEAINTAFQSGLNEQTSKLENSCKVVLEEKNEELKEKFDETNLKLEGQNERMEEHKYEVMTKLDAFQSGLGE